MITTILKIAHLSHQLFVTGELLVKTRDEDTIKTKVHKKLQQTKLIYHWLGICLLYYDLIKINL